MTPKPSRRRREKNFQKPVLRPIGPLRKIFIHKKRLTDAQMLDDSRGVAKRFVAEHATGNNLLEKLESLSKKIHMFWVVALDRKKIGALWANRTASEILSTKTIFEAQGPTDQKDIPPIGGCIDHTIAMMAATMALGKQEKIPLQVFFVRRGNHSLVRIATGTQRVFVDPSEPLNSPHVTVITPFTESKINREKRAGFYNDGVGPRAIGLNRLTDFWKYSPQKNRNGQ